MTALAESAAAITASLNTENVLVRILEQISQALRVQAVSLALIDSKKEELTFRAAIGWENMESITSRIKIGQGIAGWVAGEGRGVIIPETMTDSRFDPEINRRTGLSVEAIACAPIRSRGELIGVLEAVNPNDGVFDSDALFVLTGIGSLAGTAIRHAQFLESLQAAHQRYRELFEDSIDLLMITNWEGNILEANRQAELISGYNKQDLLGMKISQLHKLDEEKTGTYFSILAEGTTVTYESQLQTKQEQPIPIQVYVRQVYIEELAHLQWIFRDITERKNLDTLREDLLSMIYHDLQSPLANVVSSLDVIGTLLYPAQDTSLTSMVNIAKRSTDRIQRLTNSLLDINRLEAGQPVRNRLAINPAFLAQDAVETVFPLTQSKNQELINNVPAGLPQVLVDGDMIRRVLVNLLENAIKYTQQNGKIQLGGDQDDGWIKLWVEDNGPAVPDSEHERIFQKFTRLSYREAPKGLGLGLAYCRLAVEGHGGKIWLDSKLKAGARFVFTLPIAINPA
jgi:NtrC-family two-component system sensor histidine kinase KinB